MLWSRRAAAVALRCCVIVLCLPALAEPGAGHDAGENVEEALPSILITQPQDGEKVQGYKVVLQYTSTNAQGDVAILFNGARIATTKEAQATLEIPNAPIGQHYVEVHVLPADGEDILASDGVEIFVLGDGVLGPLGLDDDGAAVGDVEAAVSAGRVHERAGQLEQAHDAYALAVERASNAPGPWVPEACIGLGRVLALKGDLAGALLAMRDAVWHTPASAEAHAWIAHLLDAQEKRPNAEAAEKYLLRGVAELHHFVFTDRVEQVTADVRGLRAWQEGRIHITHREHDGWPSASMKRAHTYYEFRDLWSQMDYVYAVDVDTLCVSYIGREISGDSVGTLHADNARYHGVEHHGSHALLTGAVYERREQSVASIPLGEGTYYFAGGFYGGVSAKMVAMLAELVEYTNRDLEKGIVAQFHDESQINRYWLRNPPSVILTCAYLYPEPTMEPCWGYAGPLDSSGESVECVRDHGHPWLWSPWKPSLMNGEHEPWTPSLWGSHRRFAIRLLNLSKDKWKLISDGDAGTEQ